MHRRWRIKWMACLFALGYCYGSAFAQVAMRQEAVGEFGENSPVPLLPRSEGDGGNVEDEVALSPSVAEQMEALSERLERLEQQGAGSVDGKAKKAPTSRGSEPAKEFTDKWNVKLGGHVQMDYINWANASPVIPDTRNYFEFRRLRLVADGTGYGNYDFRLQMTLEPETVGESPAGTVTSPDVKDAYFSVNELPVLGRLRIGNFFVPFSLEQVTNDTNNIFIERSIPTQGIFSADREVGIAAYNHSPDLCHTWSTGIFFDSISEGLKERIDDNQGYRLSGRYTWLPYYDASSRGRYLVHTGTGILYTSDQDQRVRIRARPQIHEGPRLIDTGVVNADAMVTGNLECAVVWGPVAVQSEGFVSGVQRLQDSQANLTGGYVHVSYFLTGENRVFERFGQHGPQFGRNLPREMVYATECDRGWGAWELKARYSHLNLDSLNAGQYNDFTAGVNWYWSERVRMMFDWIHPVTSESTTFGATRADLLAMRFDYNW